VSNFHCYTECHYAECHYAECHYAECHYAECHYAECHYAVCRYAECRYAECHYAEYHYAECHNADCRYAECHYAECRYAECHYADCHYAECHYAECFDTVSAVKYILPQQKKNATVINPWQLFSTQSNIFDLGNYLTTEIGTVRCSTQVGPSNYKTRLKLFVTNKRSSLFSLMMNGEEKSFTSLTGRILNFCKLFHKFQVSRQKNSKLFQYQTLVSKQTKETFTLALLQHTILLSLAQNDFKRHKNSH
jgi:hypothetical protein